MKSFNSNLGKLCNLTCINDKSVPSASPKSHAQAHSTDAFRFVLITPACGIDFKRAPYFVPDAAEHCDLLFFCSRRASRIIKTPMVPVHLAGKHRAGLVRVSADGDDGLDLLT